MDELNKESIILYNPNYVLREIHGSYFLVDITDKYSQDLCSLIEVNEVASYIWRRIGDDKTLANISKSLYEEIVDDVPYEEIYTDVKGCINYFLSEGICCCKENA